MGETTIDPARRPRALARALAAAALTAAVALAFARVLKGELVYDDLWLVATNPTIRSLRALPRAFTQAYWDFLDPQQAALIGYWRPLASVALWLGHALGGGAPWGFHAVSLGLHALAVLAAWRLVQRVTGRETVAFAAALLFALHPVQVESVAWISSVNAPLEGLFGLLALDAWLAWRRRASDRPAWTAAGWLLLALLSKETALALVPTAMAIDGIRVRSGSEARRGRELLRGWLPLLGVVVLWWGLRALVFKSPWAGIDRVTTELNVSLARLATLRIELLGGYLGLAFWPAHPNAFRDVHPELPLLSAPILLGAGWSAAAAAAAILAYRRRAETALTALALLVIGVLPMVARVESIGRFLLSDRFLYLPVLGACTLAALALARLGPRAGTALALALAALLGWRSHERAAVWHDELALFETSAEQSPDSPYVQWGLGRVYLSRYLETGDPQDAQAAFDAYQRIVALHDRVMAGDESIYASADDFLQANLGQGWCLLLEADIDPLHQYEPAESVFRATLKLFPDSEAASTGLGVALSRQGKPDEARAAFRDALAKNPKYWEASWNLGQMEYELGRWPEAARAFHDVLAWRPDNAVAHARYAASVANLGQTADAERHLELALKLDPELVEAWVLRGSVSAGQGHLRDAVVYFDRALELEPGHPRALIERGRALIAQGRMADAVRSLQKACASDPSSFEAHYMLATLLVRGGDEQHAIEIYEKALELEPTPELARAIRDEIERLRALL